MFTIVLSLLVGFSGAGFAASPGAPCSFLGAITKRGSNNKCLMEIGESIKNPEDKKAYYSKLKDWNPPQGLSIGILPPFVEVSVKGKQLAEFAWISYKPAILIWNGKVLVGRTEFSSLTQTIQDLMDQAEKSQARFDFFLPTAVAADPTQDTAKDVLFYFTQAEWAKGKLKDKEGRGSVALYPGWEMMDAQGRWEPSLECSGHKVTKANYHLEEEPDAKVLGIKTLSWIPTQDPNKFVVKTDGGQSFLIDFTSRPADKETYFTCDDRSEDHSECADWNKALHKKYPELAAFDKDNGYGDDSHLKCDRFIRAKDKQNCSKFASDFARQNKVGTAYGMAPAFSQCLNADCTKSKPLTSVREVGATFTSLIEKFKDESRAQFKNKKVELDYDVAKAKFELAKIKEPYLKALKALGYSEEEIERSRHQDSGQYYLPKDAEERINNHSKIREINDLRKQINTAAGYTKDNLDKYSEDSFFPDWKIVDLGNSFKDLIGKTVSARVLKICENSVPCRRGLVEKGHHVCGSEGKETPGTDGAK